MDAGLKRQRRPNPRENAFILSKATFWFTIPTFIEGFKHDLEEKDLTETLTDHKSSILGDKLEKAWEMEVENAKKRGRKPSLKRAFVKVFGLELFFYGILLALSEIIRVAQPIVIGKVLDFYRPNQNELTLNDAYLFATGVVLCSLVNILCVHPYMMGMLHLGMKMRVACCSVIYRKSLKLSKTALGETTVGQMVNLLSNDVNRFDVCALFAHQLWLAPLETIVCTYLMYLQVGVSAVIGVGFLLMFVPMQIFVAKKISVVRLQTALRTDERVRLMNEIISGIQVIKMYAWEKPFAKLVALTRRFEIKSIRRASNMRGVILTFVMYTTRIAIFASVLSYALIGHDVTAEKVFVLSAFYNILRQTMTIFFPQGIAQVSEAFVSIRRLDQFLLYDEIITSNTNNPEKPALEIRAPDEALVKLSAANARWNAGTSDDTLENISLEVKSGKLLAVIGPVGAGKTTLFHLLLKELPLTSGHLTVEGRVSYASQEAWLFAGTVRQNILFGQPMDRARYRTVVQKCALKRDFSLLPYGDKTIVGDRGVSLSGGQRARINLARAVYKDADIYLLDDPLSAVDTHVGKQLFDECIMNFLKNKIVILVTHQLQYLKEVDHIIYLNDGKIEAEGTYQQLQESGLDFTQLLNATEETDTDNKEIIDDNFQRHGSIKSIASLDAKDAPVEVQEHKSTGSVGAYVYGSYFKAGGNCCLIFMLFFWFIIAQLFGSLTDYFLTYWVNLEQEKLKDEIDAVLDHHNYTGVATADDDFWHFSRETSIYIYSSIVAFLIVTTTIRSFYFFMICMRSSTRLHDRLFDNVISATMRFFNTNSAGRILNRFSKDMGAIDELLPAALLDCIQIGLNLVGIVVVIGIVNPWLLLPTCVIATTSYFLRIFYIRTSRNIKRLEGVTRSPVFSHLNASLQGLTTIRAYGANSILIKEFDNHQDLHSSAWYNFISTSRAFGYWLDLTCIIYISIITFSFLVIGNEKFGGNVGLVITQAISITGMLQWGMRQSTELENQMTSVERVLEYNNIEQETKISPQISPAKSWPEHGGIIFRHVFLRYFPQEPPVLRDLNFTIEPREKVGIVGRTGAGKSSLINALFQLTETEGEILVDDVNISMIGLDELRAKISIIPQEPVLFSGTLRKNLDPFDEYTDAQLWSALEDVELKEVVADTASGLNAKMSEGGSNFSVGQRQLVCLARAILRNNRVLVLDEATANVDPHTDVLVQQTIRRKFAECTVLTIAHRLHTVMDSDKVLVMDAGRVKEYDHAHNLLKNRNGIFYGMVQQTGPSMAENLLKIAEDAYFRTNK